MKSIAYIDRSTQQLIEENPPGEAFLKFLYHHPLGELSLQLLVKRKLLSSLYGRLMDRVQSAKKIQEFVDTYGIDMSESQKSVSEFSSFNDFFYRHLQVGARPIQEGLVSPAEGKILVFENTQPLKQFFVKGLPFTIEGFLQNQDLAQTYAGASLVIIRLAPPDYHRFHFPYPGKASSPRLMKGAYYSVSPYAITPNFGRVFLQNKRSITQLTTADKGTILLCPVGATMVGSILHTYQANQEVVKGQEMGYFAFGGSSIVMILPKGRFQLDADLLENTRNGMETSIKMGEKIGI